MIIVIEKVFSGKSIPSIKSLITIPAKLGLLLQSHTVSVRLLLKKDLILIISR